MHVLPSTQAFKCKLYQNGLIRKFKARFYVRDDSKLKEQISLKLLPRGAMGDYTFTIYSVSTYELIYHAS